MPDSTPDLVALADQVKLLSGDLNRRFNQVSDSITQLSTRMDTLRTTRKVTFPIAPALIGDWLDGTTSPALLTDNPSGNVEAGGFMHLTLVLPDLSRISSFQASVRVSDADFSGEGTLLITLEGTNGNVAELSCPIVPGIASPQGNPIPGMELVDNGRIQYTVGATLLITGLANLQPGKVIIESFQIDCIVA